MPRVLTVLLVIAAVGALLAWWMLSGRDDAQPSGGSTATERRDTSTEASRPPAGSPRSVAHDEGPVARDESPAATDGGTALATATAAGGDGGSDARAAVEKWLEQNAALAEKHVDRFCEESKLIKRAPPGPAETRSKDASSFLTVRIDWEDNVRPPGLLHLPEALRTRLKKYGSDWPRAITDADLVGLDFSWFTTLHQFDHWNLMAEGPLRDVRNDDFYKAPIPNFIELQSWTKLRLARAMRAHDFEQASADIHQLVSLLRSTGLVIADMFAVALLGIERGGLEYATSSGFVMPVGLSYSAEELARERRVGRTAMFFLQPGVKESVMRKAALCNAHFRCSALAEGLGAHVTLSGLAGAETFSAVSAMASGASCNGELMDWIRRASPRPPTEALSAMAPPNTLENVLLDLPADAGR